MTAADVIDIYSTLGGLGIHIWIDGGWGVDALLDTQTRHHKDLDIVLEDRHLLRFERFLVSRGYRRTKREIERPFNFVLADRGGREIDVHVIALDENGNGKLPHWRMTFVGDGNVGHLFTGHIHRNQRVPVDVSLHRDT